MTVSGNMNVNIDGGSPWGFRLQGGGHFPLQVLKVRKRSKAQRHLVEGDIIIKVNGIPANGKTHEAVMDMVDATVGPILNLEIYRGEALQKIPKKVVGPTPLASVAPASQKSATSSSVRMSEHSQHRQTTEESMYQKKMSSQQQMSQKSTSVFQQQQQQKLQQQQQQQKQQQQQRLQQQQQQQQQQQYQQQQEQQQHQQQQQVTKSNIVLKNQAQQQQKVTQIQQSSQWQESSSQQQHYQQQQYQQQKHQQQHMTVKQQQKAMQHQQMLREQQQLAEQQMAEQQMALKQLAEQRQHAQTQRTTSEQESIQTVADTSSVVEQSESVQEEESTTTTTNSVSTAIWTSGQSSSLDQKQTNLVLQAYTSSPKPFKPKVAGHLPLRPCSPARPSPCPSPAPATPIPAAFDDKENWAPSPVPSKPPTPAPNVPQFNVKNVKGIVNQNWNEVELQELNLPVPDYSKKMPILPPSSREPSPPPIVKKTIEIPDMTIRPGPPVAPKPKRVLGEVQPEPFIPDHEIIPIYTEDRPHLPVFGPPVMYGLNPALAPKRSTSMGEEESMVSETSSGSRRNDPNDPKKQKIYSDSSFYYDPKGVYPTIEDQIDLCKKISQSLTAAANTKARGATMFAKRQKRSIKWIHDGYSEGNVADLEELCSELDQTEGGTKPLFQFRIPKLAQQISVDNSTKMSLSREEFETMRTTQPKVDHTAVNPNACMSIVSDLQNSKGRGAKLFAKRQARCDKWVIDDKTSSVSAPVTPSEPPSCSPSVSMMNAQNRLADMIMQPMPIIQPKPKPAQKAPLPDPPVAKKNMGVPLPTVNANLQAEFKNLVEGPNFNRTARGWNAASTMPQSRAPRAQSVQPSSTKGPPPPVAPKPGKCMKHNPRPTLRMGDEQPPLHYRSSSDQLRLLSPRDPYHDASGYCSDVDHRTKVYSFKKPGMFRPKRFVAGAPMSQPVYCSDL